jgi:hypothetical protein
MVTSGALVLPDTLSNFPSGENCLLQLSQPPIPVGEVQVAES